MLRGIENIDGQLQFTGPGRPASFQNTLVIISELWVVPGLGRVSAGERELPIDLDKPSGNCQQRRPLAIR